MKFSDKNLKSNSVKAIIFAIVFALALAIPTAISASDYNPENDPLITLGYLNDVVIPQIKDSLMESLSAVIDQKLVDSSSNAGNVTVEKSASYEVVELKYGQKLIAEGSVEFILRPGGQAKVISPHADIGLSDLTHGTELLDGAEISQNSYCMIPRGDGRGITATSSEAYIMVRGDYSIAK